MTVLEVVDEVGISVGSTDSIINEDLGIHRVAAKFVPKLLSLEQRQLHVEVYQDMLWCTNREPKLQGNISKCDSTVPPILIALIPIFS